jgi:hypothetical protein
MTYIPPSLPIKQSDWPTLGSMIDSGKRVVVFLDSQADGPAPVDFILPEFSMVFLPSILDYLNLMYCSKIWETPFSVTNASFPCSVNRIHGPLATEDHMYMINHSLNKNILPIGDGVIITDPIDAPTTNGVPSCVFSAFLSHILTHMLACTCVWFRILANANGCAPLGGNRAPTFVLLDYVNIGAGFEAADQLNGLV